MTTRHTISRADTLWAQSAYYPPFNALPGLPLQPMNYVTFGGVAIAAASANAICASQSSSGGTNALTVNGALATAGVATIPTPRNVVAAWTTAAVITVTGTDYYGQPQTESAVSGTSFTGKKGFATVTAVTFSGAVTLATVGTGVAIALPYRVDIGGIQNANADNTPDVTFTFVVADTTSPATTTTGDVRGTITFTSAPNTARKYSVLLIIADRTGGTDKKTGAFGVTPV